MRTALGSHLQKLGVHFICLNDDIAYLFDECNSVFCFGQLGRQLKGQTCIKKRLIFLKRCGQSFARFGRIDCFSQIQQRNCRSINVCYGRVLFDIGFKFGHQRCGRYLLETCICSFQTPIAIIWSMSRILQTSMSRFVFDAGIGDRHRVRKPTTDRTSSWYYLAVGQQFSR